MTIKNTSSIFQRNNSQSSVSSSILTVRLWLTHTFSSYSMNCLPGRETKDTRVTKATPCDPPCWWAELNERKPWSWRSFDDGTKAQNSNSGLITCHKHILISNKNTGLRNEKDNFVLRKPMFDHVLIMLTHIVHFRLVVRIGALHFLANLSRMSFHVRQHPGEREYAGSKWGKISLVLFSCFIMFDSYRKSIGTEIV